MAKKVVVSKAPTKVSSIKKTGAKAKVVAAKKSLPTPKAKSGAIFIPVDDHCPIKSKASVVDQWDVMLNQTNIGANNNKFYVIQLLSSGNKFFTWTRWGRVGETGQSAMLGTGSREDAEKQFAKKFQDKTSNTWEKREQFVAKRASML